MNSEYIWPLYDFWWLALHRRKKPMFCIHTRSTHGDTDTGTITLNCGLVAVCIRERKKSHRMRWLLLDWVSSHSFVFGFQFRQRFFLQHNCITSPLSMCMRTYITAYMPSVGLYTLPYICIIKTNRLYFSHSHTHIVWLCYGCVRARVEIHFVWPYAIVFRSSILSLSLPLCVHAWWQNKKTTALLSFQIRCSLLISLPSKGKWQTHKLYTIK